MSSQRLLELLLGLDAGFLSREGTLDLAFRPRWPLQEAMGIGLWNFLAVLLVVAVVVVAYRRDGRSRRWRIGLGVLRAATLLFLVFLLNRPTLSLERVRIEPSVVAVLVDRSASMRVGDVGEERVPRIEAARSLAGEAMAALREQHETRLFAFDTAATPIETAGEVEAIGEQTSLATAAGDALRQLRGQNVAGLVVLTDGRDTESDASGDATLRQAGVPVYAIGVGDPAEPANVTIESVSAEPTVFAGDLVNVVARVRARGIEGGPVTVRLLREDGSAALDAEGEEITATLDAGEEAGEVELQLPTGEAEALALVVAAEAPAGVRETDEVDNRRSLRVDVLEAEIKVLYVEGYPRWEYRYLKNRLIRDETIDASILLTSADPDFAQEGNSPIGRFPITAEELQAYDVVLIGDVSPRQFGDGQLELIREFVGDRGGGFVLVAGPRFGPWAWRGTAIEALLPVDVVSEPSESVAAGDGWRPDVTEAGERTGIFRFYADREANDAFIATGLPELYWYATGVRAKAGVGDVLAVQPDDVGPDGREAPLLVSGRYGAGRTLFNGIDESWRWRYYTGEGVFDTFWVQQLRYLARGRKLGERRAALSVSRPSYELGERATAELRILDPRLAGQLPDRVEADLADADGNPRGTIVLDRRTGTGDDRYTGTFAADRPGGYTLRVAPLAGDVPELAADFAVELPRGELRRPATDYAALARLAESTGGRVVPASEAGSLAIEVNERRVPVLADRALWDAPVAMALLAVLLTLEWVGRKLAGLV